MKKIILFAAFALTVVSTISSCGPKCEKCHAEIMGVKSPDQEYCGDQLKEVKKNPNMVCDKKD